MKYLHLYKSDDELKKEYADIEVPNSIFVADNDSSNPSATVTAYNYVERFRGENFSGNVEYIYKFEKESGPLSYPFIYAESSHCNKNNPVWSVYPMNGNATNLSIYFNVNLVTHRNEKYEEPWVSLLEVIDVNNITIGELEFNGMVFSGKSDYYGTYQYDRMENSNGMDLYIWKNGNKEVATFLRTPKTTDTDNLQATIAYPLPLEEFGFSIEDINGPVSDTIVNYNHTAKNVIEGGGQYY